jgi:peptidyl-Lys metalloendopeptidase
MLFRTLFRCIGVIAALVMAVPVVAGGLSASLKTDDVVSFTASGAIEVEFTLTNTSPSDVSVLAWDTPLRGVENEPFVVLREGQPVAYTGLFVEHLPARASDYIRIPAGGSVSARVNLGESYDLTQGGQFEVSYAPQRLSVRQTGMKGVQDSSASVTSDVVTLSVTGLSADERTARAAADEIAIALVPSFQSCSAAQQSSVRQAAGPSRTMASNARTLARNTGSSRYRKWFGAPSSSRNARVTSVHNSIVNFQNGTVPFTCNCSVCPGAVACTLGPLGRRIALCPAFFSGRGVNGYGGRAGVIHHELSHWAGTVDVTYGPANSQRLAASNPNNAVRNADNYHTFATVP